MSERRDFERFGVLIKENAYKVNIKRPGIIMPDQAGILVGGGLLSGITLLGAGANANDADGRAISETSAGGGANQCGIIPALYVNTRTAWNPVIWGRFKLSQVITQRFWVGLFNASPMAIDVPGAGGLDCVGIRQSTGVANTNFVAVTSNGATGLTNVSDFPVAVPADALVHNFKIEVKNAGAGVTITLDNQSVSFLTNLPVVATDQGLVFAINELAVAVKVFRVYYGYIEADR
jgi:hypothetical protein